MLISSTQRQKENPCLAIFSYEPELCSENYFQLNRKCLSLLLVECKHVPTKLIALATYAVAFPMRALHENVFFFFFPPSSVRLDFHLYSY